MVRSLTIKAVCSAKCTPSLREAKMQLTVGLDEPIRNIMDCIYDWIALEGLNPSDCAIYLKFNTYTVAEKQDKFFAAYNARRDN